MFYMSPLMFTVKYRYYVSDYDYGHFHWTDGYESFDTMTQAQQFIADIDRSILNGDSDVRPGCIVDLDDIISQPSRW